MSFAGELITELLKLCEKVEARNRKRISDGVEQQNINDYDRRCDFTEREENE